MAEKELSRHHVHYVCFQCLYMFFFLICKYLSHKTNLISSITVIAMHNLSCRYLQNLGTASEISPGSMAVTDKNSATEQVSYVPDNSSRLLCDTNVHQKGTLTKVTQIPSAARDSVAKHICSLCGRKYMTKKSLREHTKKHFLERVKCHICDRSYKNESMLKIHVERHKGPRKYTCQHCNKEFIFLAHLKYHLRIIHKKKLPESMELRNSPNKKEVPTTSHICHQCGKSFKTTQVLKAHERFVHQLVPKKQICEVCGKMFHLASKLKRHMVQHTGEKPFECEKCSMRFGHKQTLRNHQICHSDLRPFKCKFCGKAFKRERNMRGHEEKNHGLVVSHSDQLVQPEHGKDGISYTCTICEKGFSLKQRLDAHLAYHKRQFMSFPCNLCGKVLTSKHGRDNHIRTHTGERPYACKVCGLALKTQAQLRTHNETHTDTKPFHCTTCNKRFRRRPHLETHFRTHTGEKPFACDVCGRCFAQNGDMKKHRLKLHGPIEPK